MGYDGPMKWRIPLAWKLIAGFSLITLSIGFTGLIGVESMDTVTTKLSKISDEDNLAIAKLSNARIEASYHSRAIYRFLLARTEDREWVTKTLAHRQKTVEEQITLYRHTSLTEEEFRLLNQFTLDWTAYLSVASDFMNRSGTAFDRSKNQEFLERIAKAEDDLEALIHLNEGYVEIDKTEGKRAIDENRNKLFLILIISKLLSVGFAVWFSLRITSSLKRLSRAVRQVNERAPQIQFPIFRSVDEISELNGEIQKLLTERRPS